MDLEELRTSPELANVTLNNCSKEFVRELHTMTVYECKNVTKTHCTTPWELDENSCTRNGANTTRQTTLILMLRSKKYWQMKKLKKEERLTKKKKKKKKKKIEKKK